MDEATKSADLIRADIKNLRNKYGQCIMQTLRFFVLHNVAYFSCGAQLMKEIGRIACDSPSYCFIDMALSEKRKSAICVAILFSRASSICFHANMFFMPIA